MVYLQVRPDLSKDQLRLLADAGIRRLEVGIESLSTPVLRLMRKGTTALKCVQFLKWARELGIEVIWNVLWGFPGEDPREYQKMADMVPLLAHLQPPNSVGSFRLDRFSPAFEDPDGFGLAAIRPYPSYGYVYDLPEEALAGLAYFFVFDYARPQDVAAYTLPLAEAIASVEGEGRGEPALVRGRRRTTRAGGREARLRPGGAHSPRRRSSRASTGPATQSSPPHVWPGCSAETGAAPARRGMCTRCWRRSCTRG